jgi:hypothetical protein
VLTDIHLIGSSLDFVSSLDQITSKFVQFHFGKQILDPVRVWQILLPLVILLGQRITSSQSSPEQEISDFEHTSYQSRNESQASTWN